ncbi:MAG: DUF3795 domain-containing protein [Solirubrobacterales bacterium]
MINYETVVEKLAPCGIDCSRCAYYEKGRIVLLSKELQFNLINFKRMADKAKAFMPIFGHYEEFSAILKHLSEGNCKGCRLSSKPQCSINECSKAEKADFCFQCSKFPCTPITYNESVKNSWVKNNNEMKNKGVEEFYLEQIKKPRY